MTRFILRVDDVGQIPEPQHIPDRGLNWFRRWWDAGEWGEEPVYLGVVPANIEYDEKEWLLRLEETTGAEIALHGWDHSAGYLTAKDIILAHKVFPAARAVIPPYNLYKAETLHATGTLSPGRGVLFGGIPSHGHHTFGPAPTVTQGVLHLAAHEALYLHSYRMIDAIEEMPDPGYPVVVTCHHRWDRDFLDGVKRLRNALKNRLVTVEEAWP
jgi:hypothetical protein